MDDDMECQSTTKYKTTPYLTKFELTRIIGMRTLQISMSPNISTEKGGSANEIATHEVFNKLIPITVRRYLPDGTYEDRNLKDLIIEPTLRIHG